MQASGHDDNDLVPFFQEFETLCHEFGHVLHALLSQTDFQHVSGTRGPSDFTEIPSHLFERFASSPEFLRCFARHRCDRS